MVGAILEFSEETHHKKGGGFTLVGARKYGFKKGYVPWNKGKKTGIAPTKGMKMSMKTRAKISKNNAKYWKGKKFSEEHKRKLRENHANFNSEKSVLWKGENVKNVALHQWVAKHKGRPTRCEMCGDTTKRYYDWANIDHNYKRDLNDYIRLCRKCHRKFDMENNNYKLGKNFSVFR